MVFCSFKRKKGYFNINGKIIWWDVLRYRVFERDNYTCKLCGNKFNVDNLIIDHIIPIAIGGNEYDINNLQTLCKKCHKIKTKEDLRLIKEYKKIGEKVLRIKQVRLF